MLSKSAPKKKAAKKALVKKKSFAPKFEVKRRTSGTFSSEGHTVRYDKKTCKISCSCAQFTVTKNCEMFEYATKILEEEGNKVVKPRMKIPQFIKEQENFKSVMKEIYGHIYKSRAR